MANDVTLQPTTQEEDRPPSRREQAALRKSSYADGRVAPFLRPMLSVQQFFTFVLLRLNVNSRMVTLAWFVTGLAAAGAIAWGAAWSFAAGAVLLHLKIVLDITDGELGRYQKRFLTPRQDLLTHMQGIYLDRMFHAIENPILGLALGAGAYRMTGAWWVFPCGLALAVFRTMHGFDGPLRVYVVDRFRDRAAALDPLEIPGAGRGRTGRLARFAASLVDSVALWLRNGKRLYLMVFVAGIAHWIATLTVGTNWVAPTFLAFVGIASAALVPAKILLAQTDESLARQLAAKTSQERGTRGESPDAAARDD